MACKTTSKPKDILPADIKKSQGMLCCSHESTSNIFCMNIGFDIHSSAYHKYLVVMHTEVVPKLMRLEAYA